MTTNCTSQGLIDGLVRVAGIKHADERGTFAKVFSSADLQGLGFPFVDVFWSQSSPNVIRGMHLQMSPFHGRKLVWVSSGIIRDVVLDLRRFSPTFLNWCAFELDWEAPPVLIPAGCAHGFEVTAGSPIVNYAQECAFHPEFDTGIRWDSAGLRWSIECPILSPRDMALPTLEEFLEKDYVS